MERDLERILVSRKTGDELFRAAGDDLGFTLLDFWQWSASDLVSNATRGRLAEYVVAKALGASTSGVRNEWDAYDLRTESGIRGIRVEVKSAAYVQTWFQKQFSSIAFLTRPTRAWDADTNRLSSDAKRQADVYVFALLGHRDKSTVDPLNIDQWQFYVLSTQALNARTRSQHSITLKSLAALTGAVLFSELRGAVQRAAAAELSNHGIQADAQKDERG